MTYVSVVGSSLLHCQQAGTPIPLAQWVHLHGHTSSVMVGGALKELELRETPCLCPRHSYKDVGRPQGQGDPGADKQADGPLGEISPRGTGGGC